jgi:hypothetical protein
MSTHFERLRKLVDKSGHYYWKCNYCADLEGNRLLKLVAMFFFSTFQTCEMHPLKYIKRHTGS